MLGRFVAVLYDRSGCVQHTRARSAKERLLGLARFVHFARRRRKLQFMIRCASFAGLVLAILIIGTAPAAWADSIGPTGCVNDSCFGNVFTLEFSNLTAPDTIQAVDVTLTIDTAATTLAITDVIRDVAFKVTPQDPLTAALTSFSDDGVAGNPALWAVSLSGLNNNGCGAGAGGFVCAADADIAPLDGSVYQWVFHLTFDSGTLITTAGGATVHVRYCAGGTDCNRNNFEGLTSEPITLQQGGGGGEEVPAPAAIILLGTALTAYGLMRRMRR